MNARAYSYFLIVALVWALPAPVQAQEAEGTSDVVSLDVQPAASQQRTAQRTDYQEAVVTGGVFFRDPSGENKLDAGESATLRVTLSNQGTKAAQGIQVTLRTSSSVEGLSVGKKKEKAALSTEERTVGTIDALRPAAAQPIEIALHASDSLPEESIQLVVGIQAQEGKVIGSPKNVSIPIGEVTTAPVVDRQIPKTNMDRKNAVAVVIGVSQYQSDDIPAVDYAVQDAEIVKRYLTRTMGFDPANVIYLENPTKSSMDAILGSAENHKGRLSDLTTRESEVFVFYSGHGAPGTSSGSGGKTYFLPSDARPNQLSLTGYPVDLMYENLAKVTSGPVTVVIDACFSGQSERGTLVKKASPALLNVESPIMGMKNGLVLTASKADQISSWYPEKQHGLFTYYFLKGFQKTTSEDGTTTIVADQNGDKSVTGAEMGEYISKKVSRQARRLHSRKQNPQILGQDTDRVLVTYDN
jgi:hypothetical protein